MQQVFVIHVFAVGNWAIFGLVVPPVTCLLSVQITILPERVNDLATVRSAQGTVCVRALANGKLLRTDAQGVEYVLLGISLARARHGVDSPDYLEASEGRDSFTPR